MDRRQVFFALALMGPFAQRRPKPLRASRLPPESAPPPQNARRQFPPHDHACRLGPRLPRIPLESSAKLDAFALRVFIRYYIETRRNGIITVFSLRRLSWQYQA